MVMLIDILVDGPDIVGGDSFKIYQAYVIPQFLTNNNTSSLKCESWQVLS